MLRRKESPVLWTFPVSLPVARDVMDFISSATLAGVLGEEGVAVVGIGGLTRIRDCNADGGGCQEQDCIEGGTFRCEELGLTLAKSRILRVMAMQFRLLAIMSILAAILLAGLLGIRHLEKRMGGAAVPGLIIVDAPWLGEDGARSLMSFWPGSRVEWVSCGDEALSPFETNFFRRVVQRGDDTLLLTLSENFTREIMQDEEGASLWPVVWGAFPAVKGETQAGQAGLALARHLRSRTGTRAFLVALVLGPERNIETMDIFADPILEACSTLPWFRRSSTIFLGVRRPKGGGGAERLALRVDQGRWGDRAADGLLDLLDLRW